MPKHSDPLRSAVRTLHPPPSTLHCFFNPTGVAIIGASADPHKLSHGVLRNMLSYGYQGAVYPVNPRANEILGKPCYPDIASVPDPVELAVLMVPAAACPAVLTACGLRGLKAAIVISGGFREVGAEGRALEDELVRIASSYGMRLIGPNCVGTLDAHTGLNSTFIRTMPKPGPIAFVSQSGAICGGILEWTAGKGVGFSRFATLGNEADVTETDLIEALADDPNTRVIVAYVEAIQDGRRFIDVASRVSLEKPILVIKAGTTQAGTRAVSSHTGSLAGEMAAYDAAFLQSGVLRVGTVEELFNNALALAYGPLPRGRRVAVVTNAGGPASLAADEIENRRPGHAVDAGGHPQTSGGIHSPRGAAGEPRRHARRRRATPVRAGSGRAAGRRHLRRRDADPGTAGPGRSRSRGRGDRPGCQVLRQAGGSLFHGRRRRASADGCATRASNCIIPVPGAGGAGVGGDVAGCRDQRVRDQRNQNSQRSQNGQRNGGKKTAGEVSSRLSQALREGRTELGEAEARPILAAVGVPQPRAELVRTAEEAVQMAVAIGFPVALKIVSADIFHKSEVGGIALHLADETAVRERVRHDDGARAGAPAESRGSRARWWQKWSGRATS